MLWPHLALPCPDEGQKEWQATSRSQWTSLKLCLMPEKNTVTLASQFTLHLLCLKTLEHTSESWGERDGIK